MVYFPFSELLKDTFFVFHPSHWGNRNQHTLFKKVDTTSYQNPASKTLLVIPRELIHSTKVALIEVPRKKA